MNAAACNDCRNLLGGYVLHALEADDADADRRHLATCPSCAAEHGQLTGIPSILDTAGAAAVENSTEHPPPTLEEAVLDRFAREHRRGGRAQEDRNARAARRTGFAAALRRRFARPLPAALAGALAAAAISVALIVLPGGDGDDANGEQYQASLSGSPAAPGARASAKLQVFASGTRVRLSVRGLHGSPDTVYELWCLRDDGEKVSAGTFRTDASGNADVNLTTAAIPGEYHRLGVERRTLSPAGHPATSVMTGEIRYPHS